MPNCWNDNFPNFKWSLVVTCDCDLASNPNYSAGSLVYCHAGFVIEKQCFHQHCETQLGIPQSPFGQEIQRVPQSWR